MQTLPDFPFPPRFVDVDGHRIAFVEVGEGSPMLFVHGNPTSSYTFRHVLAPIAQATGRRCIAMDLLGFGRSDKPRVDHSCAGHARIIEGFIEALDLRDVVLVAEDWGGFLGAWVMTRQPARFEAAVFMETFLWPMTWADDMDPDFTLPFRLMRSPVGDVFSRGLNVMINKLIPEHCPIDEASLQVYRDAVPTWGARKALADFPRLLPIDGVPAASQAFAEELQAGLTRIDCPVAWLLADPGVIISDKNPVGRGRLDDLADRLPQLEVLDFGPGLHFLSEERPERVVELVSGWVSGLRTPRKVTA